MNKAKELSGVIAVSLAIALGTYLLLRDSRFYGPGVFGMGLLPVALACIAGIRFTNLIPDLVFGAVDTGLLTVGAVMGGSAFGVAGAVVGGVVADAVTDGIAGFFEGGVAEWLRSKGMEEARSALGSACGKMAGCLFGSGLMLCILQVVDVGVLR